MSITVKGYAFEDTVVDEIIRQFLNGDHVRTKKTMTDLVAAHHVPADVLEAAAKRFLKLITDADQARFDPETATYRVIRTIEQVPEDRQEPSPSTDIAFADGSDDHRDWTENLKLKQTDTQIVGLSALARAVCLLISVAAILAVVSINGLFAASIAGTEMLAAILITAMVSIDLMRPFLVAMALISFRNRLWLRFAGALSLALILAPLSVFTSFSMLSAEFSKGADSRQNALQSAEHDAMTRTTLDAEIARLRRLSETQWAEWQRECANGGCGPNAGRLEGAAQRTDARIAGLVVDRKALSDVPQTAHDRASRITTSLTLFGIPETIVVQIAPLLLALGLELAAVLGPAILLVPVTPKRPVRAPRFANPEPIEGVPS